MHKPPGLFLAFFRWYCHPQLLAPIEGDLMELYEERVQELGKKKADRLFIKDTLLLFRKDIIKPPGGTQKLNYYGMFKHNLLITLRGFLRHKTVFGINLFGLIISLTCILFSILWVNDEVSKDRFHADTDQLFQVYTKFFSADGTRVWKGVTGLLEQEIEAQIPQAKIAAVSTDVHEYTLSVGNQGFKVKGRFADVDYLRMLNFPLWKGNKESLSDPSSILITKTLAKRIFGKEDVVNESVNWHFWSTEKTFRVAGILEDPDPSTSEPFDFILPWIYYHDELISFKGWGNFYGRVLVKLDPSNKQVAEAKINEIFQSNVENDQIQLFLTSFSDQYLYGNYENGEPAGGRIDYVQLATVVAIFILLIACINFVNLSTAFSSLKRKEIGVKKSFGASKRNLAFQFFSESILLAIISLIIAIICVALFLEPFNQLSGKQITLYSLLSVIGMFFLIVPVIGLIAGLYPAISLSNIAVISALKAKSPINQLKGTIGRQMLVFVQFTLSIILIVGTIIVSSQMDFALHAHLGYDRDNLLYFLREGRLFEEDKAFIAEIENTPGVLEVAKSGFSVGPEMQNRTAGVDWEGKEPDQQVSFWENNGDANSIAILGLEFVAGRDFSDDLKTETSSVIFNETAIRVMGMTDPIGKTIDHYTGKKEIIGVVKDFTTESLHNPMEPAMFFYNPDLAHYIMVKIEKGQELATLDKLETLYKGFNPSYPFEPGFVDQDYEAMYHSEMRVAKLSQLFAGLAILISCMGLFGLTIFQVQRKVKEIGIKKVLGAESFKLALAMTYDFTKAVFLALVVAIPVSYYLGSKWLENFAESIPLNGWVFVLASFFAIIISWVTVGSLTLRAANANPVEALKDE